MSNQQLADKLHKPIIRKFKRKKISSSFKDNKRISFSLCVTNIFSRYAWVVFLKDKKGVTIVDEFQNILDNPKRKANKIWVDQDSDFYNNSFKKWLDNNDIKMYSTYNEGKSVVAERFIRTLKNKIYKHMTAVSEMFIWMF